jgi:hypothetical protein
MRAEIRRYLEEHGETYTTEALRRGLLDAGHPPGEVDDGLREWQAERSVPDVPDDRRRAFGWWAFGLHAAALLLVALWLLTQPGALMYGMAPITIVVLALALLIGWAISRAIGRRMLPGSGLSVALIVPAISALLIGGSCFAMLGGLTGV